MRMSFSIEIALDWFILRTLNSLSLELLVGVGKRDCILFARRIH